MRRLTLRLSLWITGANPLHYRTVVGRRIAQLNAQLSARILDDGDRDV
jgi:hypothetical protein